MSNPNSSPRGPYWKRMHHSFGFWIALFLMLAAMFIYVMTGDLGGLQTRPAQLVVPASPAR